jgi:CheY-like chemotaxis protein
LLTGLTALYLLTGLIVVTGYGQVEDRLRAKEAGFDSHITKPVNPTELAALPTRQPLA